MIRNIEKTDYTNQIIPEFTERWRYTTGHKLKRHILFEHTKLSCDKCLVNARNGEQYNFFRQDGKSAACGQFVQVWTQQAD